MDHFTNNTDKLYAVFLVRDIFSLVFGINAFLSLTYLSIAMGWFFNRYPVRIFSSSNPPTFLPEQVAVDAYKPNVKSD